MMLEIAQSEKPTLCHSDPHPHPHHPHSRAQRSAAHIPPQNIALHRLYVTRSEAF